jgi:hypothetical protein
MTPSVNEPATFRHVAQSLNQLRQRVICTFQGKIKRNVFTVDPVAFLGGMTGFG